MLNSISIQCLGRCLARFAMLVGRSGGQDSGASRMPSRDPFVKRRTNSSVKGYGLPPGRQKLRWWGAVPLMCLAAGPVQAEGIQAIFPAFENQLKVPPGENLPTSKGTAATFFGGHVKARHPAGNIGTVPSGGHYYLPEASFGQMADFRVRYPDVEGTSVHHAKTALYEGESAAFRYKVFLYERTEVGIAPNYEVLKTLWGDPQRQRADDAAYALTAALHYSPSDQRLRDTLLDVLYDRAIADITLAKEAEVEAIKAAMGFPEYLDPEGGFAINKEINYLKQALEYYLKAAKPYYALLSDKMGIGTLAAGGAVSDTAFGYLLFRDEQPHRSLFASHFLDGGVHKPVVDQDGDRKPDQLFAGYKDLVLLFEIERDTARLAAKLARLHALRGDSGDRDQARRLVGEALQRGYTDGQILIGMFAQLVPSTVDQTTGLTETRASWRQSINELNSVKAFIDGDTNPLGLGQGFLALVQNDEGDSYQYFEDFLMRGGHMTPAGPLGDAFAKYERARSSYETFRVYQDRIGEELSTQRRQFADRLRAITGCTYPDSPNPSSCYHRPYENQGSELWLQSQNVERARLRIERNQQEVLNLQSQIEHEIERVGRVNSVTNLIAETHIRYGEKQASLTREIADINAHQAYSNGIAAVMSAANLTNWGWGAAAQMVNAEVQTLCELAKGDLNAKKEKYSAQQSAEITYLQGQIEDANSQAMVKNLLLGMSILAIDSSEASLLLGQEVGRLQALLDEKDYLEAQWAEARGDLRTRYFADPSHRIVQSRDILLADQAFQKGRLWVFILARALDYKWNRKVIADGYSAETAFKLRNAQELSNMATALYQYNAAQNIGGRHGNTWVRFSAREDFLGYRRVDTSGNPLSYPDPVTGESVDALTAFRSYLKHVAPHIRPDWGTNAEVVRLRFSTAKPNFQGTFFSPDRHNEKINWLEVTINAEYPRPDLAVRLEQRGTAFLRNETRGTVLDAERPDLVSGEMTAYSVQFWYRFTDPETGVSSFRSKDAIGSTVNAVVIRDPHAPPGAYQARQFHELSPAISDWTLEIPILHTSGEQVLDLDRINDIEIWFYNYYRDRS